MIVDIHNHVGIRVGKSRTGSELIQRMNRAGCGQSSYVSVY